MNQPAIQEYNYHKWANDKIFNHLKKLPSEAYSNEVKSVFSSIKEVLIHMYQVDGMWLSVMSGKPFSETMSVIKELKQKSADPSLDELINLYEEVNKQYQSFFADRNDLDEPIEIEHPTFGKLNTRVSDLIKHVVNHGTYHRGNITAMLRQQGHAGAPTDYIFYLYEIQ